ncbi:hypothetical protein [Sphingobacterium chuzhouense]|uniref:Uncharacterized protein n=1 Tax=Sphingobacterium chuzhouense TaxID=1742264 RepID=A0ABR7XP58_9SPHI|nr:hypothetical protein [Sphingobacterium chuzhouense]MBD1420956.1 hypothetical protein [Sphingobacterium chuzhouense]
MSEPNSLYVKIKITKEKLQQFFQDKPRTQTIDENWLTWWDSREMYSKQPLENIPVYRMFSNRHILDELIKDRDFACSEQYDPISQNWIFVSVFFSENYTEILPMLAFLKNLANYQHNDGGGLAMIYDFLWGEGSIMAYLEFSGQQATLKPYTNITALEPTILYTANQALEKAVDSFNKNLET